MRMNAQHLHWSDRLYLVAFIYFFHYFFLRHLLRPRTYSFCRTVSEIRKSSAIYKYLAKSTHNFTIAFEHILFNLFLTTAYNHGVLDRVFRFPLRNALLDDRMGTEGVFFFAGVVLAFTGVVLEDGFVLLVVGLFFFLSLTSLTLNKFDTFSQNPVRPPISAGASFTIKSLETACAFTMSMFVVVVSRCFIDVSSALKTHHQLPLSFDRRLPFLPCRQLVPVARFPRKVVCRVVSLPPIVLPRDA